ncbi:HAMP domain-containing protein [Motiliproteus coralliicola]|uniref:histidine kinase n=1 Tax=Motiliproteus coralliicola TaxID=2283196 RepID=A0A369WEU5_9GAMM|nr:ATP-binding protein [Motiliproteus coralliicola]RDE19136.1 HAMP domain-containing protein [Motiliproteus coralliicola]
MQPGIRLKLLSSFLVLVLAVVGVFSYTSINSSIESMHQQARSLGSQLVQAFSQLAGPYILESDYATVIASASQLIEQGHINEIMITDIDGKIWLSTQTDSKPLPMSDPFYRQVIKKNLGQTRRIDTDSITCLEFVAPISTFGNPTYLVRMMMPLTEIEQRVNTQIRETLLFALIVMLVAALAAGVLSRLLTEPIKHLLRGTSEIIRGNYSHRIEVLSKDETGQLAHSFNQMTGHLEQEQDKRQRAQQSLIEHRDNLEQQVAERTEQLTRSNTQLSAEIDVRKRAEFELEQERSLLAERVAERTEQLNRTNQDLERAAKSKDEFLAAMSHELRTPLTAILGMSEVLQEQVFGPLNDKQSEYLNIVNESGNHLLELINDILDLAKIGAGKLEIRPGEVNFVNLAETSTRLVRGQAKQQQQQIEFQIAEGLPRYIGDPRHLKQVLVNLLGNAIKFTPRQGQIGLNIGVTSDSRSIWLQVTDTGIGIAPEDQSQLFAPFVQVDSELSRQFSGTGLGLALVSRIVKLHQGHIEVDSEPGQGSCFTITLPLDNGMKVGQSLPVQESAP